MHDIVCIRATRRTDATQFVRGPVKLLVLIEAVANLLVSDRIFSSLRRAHGSGHIRAKLGALLSVEDIFVCAPLSQDLLLLCVKDYIKG